MQFLTWVLEGPLGRSFLVPLLIHRAGITRIRQIRFDGWDSSYVRQSHLVLQIRPRTTPTASIPRRSLMRLHSISTLSSLRAPTVELGAASRSLQPWIMLGRTGAARRPPKRSPARSSIECAQRSSTPSSSGTRRYALLASLVSYTVCSRASAAERAESCGAVHSALP